MKIVPVGLALSLFLAITFSLAAALHFGLHAGMAMDMPANGGPPMMDGTAAMCGVGRHGPTGLLIGLAASYALGWYTALVYVPLHNLFSTRNAA